MNKINVLHIVAIGEVNGGLSYLLELADNFSKDRFRLFFASPWQEHFYNELEKRSIKPLEINIKPKLRIIILRLCTPIGQGRVFIVD